MTMPKYRKIPVVIEAVQWDGTETAWAQICAFATSCVVQKDSSGGLLIGTLEGAMRADLGDYVILGVKNEMYPCKPDIFKLTYEAVTEDIPPATVPSRDNYPESQGQAMLMDDGHPPRRDAVFRYLLRRVSPIEWRIDGGKDPIHISGIFVVGRAVINSAWAQGSPDLIKTSQALRGLEGHHVTLEDDEYRWHSGNSLMILGPNFFTVLVEPGSDLEGICVI
jgi:hypothetical protein